MINKRQRIAKRIKEIRLIPNCQTKNEALISLIQLGKNYPKKRG